MTGSFQQMHYSLSLAIQVYTQWSWCPAETDKQDAGTSKQDAAPKVSRMLSTDTIGKASEGRTSGKNSGWAQQLKLYLFLSR